MRLVAAFNGGGLVISILLSALSAACSSGQSTLTKLSSKNDKKNSAMCINAIKLGAPLILFAVLAFKDFVFHRQTAAMAALYAISLFLSTLFGYLALANGSMVISSLIASYSVLIPCVYGIICLNENVSTVKIIGIMLLLISMKLLAKPSDKAVLNKKWIFYISVTFLCNGISSVLQKVHQTAYPGRYLNEFMFFGILICFFLFFSASLFQGRMCEKSSAKYAVGAGLFMGFANFLTLFLSSKVSASVLFPVVTMFTVILNTSISRLVFKDKLSRTQLVGIFAGVLSIVMIK